MENKNIVFLTNSFDQRKLGSDLNAAGITNQAITYIQINNTQNQDFVSQIEEKNPDVVVLNKGMSKSIVDLFNESFIKNLLAKNPNSRVFYYCDKITISGATHLKEIIDLKKQLSC